MLSIVRRPPPPAGTAAHRTLRQRPVSDGWYRSAILALHDCRLYVDETFVLQAPHILGHRVFTHSNRFANVFIAGIALVGVAVLAPEQIGVEGDLPKTQTDAEHLVGYQKIVFLCASLLPFVVTQFIPPLLL